MKELEGRATVTLLMRCAAVAIFVVLALSHAVSSVAKELERGIWNARSSAIPAFSLTAIPSLGVEGLDTDALDADQTYVINIFAQWCQPCHWEHELLMEVARVRGVVLVGVDLRDDPVKVKAWLNESGNPYRLVGADTDGAVSESLGAEGLPETLVVQNGMICYHWVGPLTEEALAGLGDLVTGLRE